MVLVNMIRTGELNQIDPPECIDLERLHLVPEWMDLTLVLDRSEAFVGESIGFGGTLIAGGEALQGRQVNVRVHGETVATAISDSRGRYQGTFEVPYVYESEMIVLAVYYPQGEDVGRHLPTSSEPVIVTVLHYETILGFEPLLTGHPGHWFEVLGTLVYETSQLPPERIVTAFLDDVSVAETSATGEFLLRIKLPDDLSPGQHTLAIEVPSSGRYAPAEAVFEFNVDLASMTLTVSTPGVASIPGTVAVSGSVSSELGPVVGAAVTLDSPLYSATVTTDEHGDFGVEFDVGLMPLIVGSLDIEVSVVPVDPWLAPMNLSRTPVVINLPGSVAFVATLLALALLMPRILRARHWLAALLGKSAVTEVQPVQTRAVYSPWLDMAHDTTLQDPAVRGVIERYRLVVRLVMAVGAVLLKPQQTLREFARECGEFLGPAARYFAELTGLVERVLYSLGAN